MLKDFFPLPFRATVISILGFALLPEYVMLTIFGLVFLGFTVLMSRAKPDPAGLFVGLAATAMMWGFALAVFLR